jgi:hypothetical protein
MKSCLLIYSIFIVASAIAQDNLPPCRGNDVTKWDNCIATANFVSGSKFVGVYRKGQSNGQGTLIYPSGDKYIGEFKDGSSNGQGTYLFTSGDVYTGQFRDGAPHGQGNITNTDGSKYSGEYKNGEKDGQGTATFPNGNRYVGEFRKSKYNGKGTFYHSAKGENYSGDFKDDQPNGQGTYTFANGTKYVGEIKNGRRNGQGVLYAQNGAVISQGLWSNEEFISPKPTNQAIAANIERERPYPNINEANQNQTETEGQLKLASNQPPPFSAPATQITSFANRRALVIGNDSYTSVTKLINAREDAKAMAMSLTSVGYKVTLKLDLNEKEMKSALRIFSSQVQGGDEVLFFFAGHGVQLGATNYLLPTDIEGESEAQIKDEAIQLQRVLDDMTEKKAKFTLAMIDACRDNPFKSTGRNIGGRGLAPTTAATGQMVVFSAGSGQQALDRLGIGDKNKNGVFTRIFLKEMQKSGVSIDRIVKNVRNEVAELAKTVGHEQVPAIYDQVLGDFYFKK